jgi:putative ABC transport system ATP-binding protein
MGRRTWFDALPQGVYIGPPLLGMGGPDPGAGLAFLGDETGARPMAGDERRVIVDVRDVKMVYNARNRDQSTHVHALRGLDVQVYENEFFAIMGPSGSGKSTLFNMIGALQSPTGGEVLLDGVNLSSLSPQQLAAVRCFELGYIFQTYNLLPVMSALMNVALPTVFAGMTTEEGEKRAMECLAIVGLDDRAHHLPSELSGGQQQRVAIARAFVNKPRIILADEPTGNLDSKTGQQIIDYMKSLQREMGATIITVTHDDKMLSAADRMAWIRDGRLERIADRSQIEIQMGSIKEH